MKNVFLLFCPSDSQDIEYLNIMMVHLLVKECFCALVCPLDSEVLEYLDSMMVHLFIVIALSPLDPPVSGRACDWSGAGQEKSGSGGLQPLQESALVQNQLSVRSNQDQTRGESLCR